MTSNSLRILLKWELYLTSSSGWFGCYIITQLMEVLKNVLESVHFLGTNDLRLCIFLRELACLHTSGKCVLTCGELIHLTYFKEAAWNSIIYKNIIYFTLIENVTSAASTVAVASRQRNPQNTRERREKWRKNIYIICASC